MTRINIFINIKNFISKNPKLFFLLLILTLTLVSFWPSFYGGFTNWDDHGYVRDNPLIKDVSIENLYQIFTSYTHAYYLPLTNLSLLTDYQIGGLNPWPFHLTNGLLHLLNTALVFWFIFLLTKKTDIAVITSVLFGVHTFHVESVAWISERKDVLFTFFFLLSLIAYVKHFKTAKKSHFIFSILLFLCSLLSKAQAVTLAPTLLVIDYLLNKPVLAKKNLLEKIPFFLLAVVFGLIAYIGKHSYAQITTPGLIYSLWERFLFSCYAFVQYVLKLIIPLNLSAIYPYPDNIQGEIPLKYILSLSVIIIILLAFFYVAKKSKLVVFCVLFFVINIILVLQVLPIGRHLMHDHYSYIPSIGFFCLIGFAYNHLSKHSIRTKKILTLILSAYILFLSVLTYNRCKIWQDSITLWSDVISKHPQCARAYFNLAHENHELNNFKAAVDNYTQYIKLNPTDLNGYVNRGLAYTMLNDFKKAKIDYQIASKADNKDTNALSGLAFSDLKLGKYADAIENYTKAIQIDQSSDFYFFQRGNAYYFLKKYKQAIDDYTEAIRINKNYFESYLNRGHAYLKTNQKYRACTDFNLALQNGVAVANQYIKENCSDEL